MGAGWQKMRVVFLCFCQELPQKIVNLFLLFALPWGSLRLGQSPDSTQRIDASIHTEYYLPRLCVQSSILSLEVIKMKMKATIRNGRATAGGKVYNANHNTRLETRAQESHIDHERTSQNINFQFTNDGGIVRCGSFDAKDFEKSRYAFLYGAGQDAKNARYIKDGHPERCRTIDQLYASPKTAPMETILQIGTRDTDIDPRLRLEMLTKAAFELVDSLRKRWGENLHFLDLSIHCDESTPHIHARMTFSALDKFGQRVPNQAQAFAAMGIHRPDPEAKESKYNCPLISFSDAIRTEFYDLCEKQGIQIDREVHSPSKKHLDALEYRCQQMEAEVEQVRAERDTLRSQNQISRTIQEALQQPERDIDVEDIPAKRNLAGKVIEPEKVKIAKSDYLWLKQRAQFTAAIQKAWTDLQRLGKQLWKEVEQNPYILAARNRAEAAEQKNRADALTIRHLEQKLETAEEKALRQESFMRGKGIWEQFCQFIADLQIQRQREHAHTR